MRTYFWLVMWLLCPGMVSIAQADETASVSTVPLFLHYHGQLTDGGGTPLSGPVALQLRITDANHTALYEEDQTVTAFAGAVSAVVGNGTEVNTGAVQGGVPIEVFTPGESRLLEVWVDGALHGDPAEIVSVPYAMWSQTALRVAPGGIGTDQLAPDFVDDFAPQLVASPAYQSALADVQSAATIGVNSTFAYSASTTLQGVLEDFDNAIKAREVKNVDRAGDTMTGKLVIAKGGLEVAGDVTVTGTVDGVDVSAAKAELDTSISTTASVQSQLTTNKSELDGEITGLKSTTTGLQGQITASKSELDGKITVINSTTTSLQSQLATKLDAGGGPMTGALNMSGTQIHNVGTPTTDADAATKKYVDDSIAPFNPAITPPPPSPQIVAWGLVNCSVDLPAGSPCPVTGSYNIASVVRLPTNGEHLVTFANGLKTAQYAAVATIINTDDEHNVSILSQAKNDLIVFAADPHWFSVMVVLNQ